MLKEEINKLRASEAVITSKTLQMKEEAIMELKKTNADLNEEALKLQSQGIYTLILSLYLSLF